MADGFHTWDGVLIRCALGAEGEVEKLGSLAAVGGIWKEAMYDWLG